MAFIPDNISAHVHLLEDNHPIKKKKQRWLLSAGFFRLADFPQKQQECFSEEHDRFISVGSVGREKSIYTIPTFSSCGAHIRSGDNIFFLFKLQRQQCTCNGPLESLLITGKMHL